MKRNVTLMFVMEREKGPVLNVEGLINAFGGTQKGSCYGVIKKKR
jgi:hypothetical protein